MNRYGVQAQRHWRQWLPIRYAQIQDPQAFFTDLGLRVAEQVSRLSAQMAGPDQQGENYLHKVGRLNEATMGAEEIVLREQVLLPPEHPETGESTLGRNSNDEQQQGLGLLGEMSTGWTPVVEDPTHPFWRRKRAQDLGGSDEEVRYLIG